MHTLSALDLKIQTFLRQAGVSVDDTTSSGIQLIRYFEEEFGCAIMPMLEQEFWEEQATLDAKRGLFGSVRKHLDEDDRPDFDAVMEKIWG